MKKEIDIIIPAYNAHNTLFKTLSSIALQFISDIVKVTIINDCSPDGGYENIVKNFEDILDIDIINLEENVGCGAARQIGLNNTSLPYISFVDADDMFSSPESLKALYEVACDFGDDIDIVFGGIEELKVKTGKRNYIGPNHITWIFGSLYKRSFLNENNIFFNNNSRGEDVAFNKMCKLYSHQDRMACLDIPVYCWTDMNENRINNLAFTHLYSKIGYVENLCWVYPNIHMENIKYQDADDIKFDMISNFVSMHFQYSELFDVIPFLKEDLGVEQVKKDLLEYFDYATQLYETYLEPAAEEITFDDLTMVYRENYLAYLAAGRALSIQSISFYQYLYCLKTKDFEGLFGKWIKL